MSLRTLYRQVPAAALLLLVVSAAQQAAAHCQVPCGIYGDQRRFESMLEDTETIAKSITQIGELSGTHDANGHNQLVRWVVTKEDHAISIQRTIADYFMAQRVKADDPKYIAKLSASHAVMVAAMKAKQSANPATAEALKSAILAFHQAYTGGAFHSSHQHH